MADVSKLIELHLRFHGYGTGEWTDSAVRRYVADAGPLLTRLHALTRADCTTRNKAKAQRLARSYDDLERRIAVLAEEEELASLRPDLDGNEIMRILGIGPGPQVGQARTFLLDLRIERGPLGRRAGHSRAAALGRAIRARSGARGRPAGIRRRSPRGCRGRLPQLTVQQQVAARGQERSPRPPR